MFLDYYDKGECEIRGTNRIWPSGACVIIENSPKNFYEAQMDCGQHYGFLLKANTSDIYEVVKARLESVKSYFFALTDQEWVFSYSKYYINHILSR